MKEMIDIDAEHIKKQAEQIRDIAQAVVKACEGRESIDSYARNKITDGSLAQDAAVLALMVVQYEQVVAMCQVRKDEL